jgi:hypothetical protein
MKRSCLFTCMLLLALLLPVAVSADFLGNISVSSTPSGANVYIDSVFNGTTLSNGFVNLSHVPVGAHTVFMNLSGYQDSTTSVTISGNDTQTVNVALSPALGSLSVASVPSGAMIYIDNTYKGMTPATVTGVQYGTRLVLLKLSGYTDWSQNVIVNTSTLAVSASLTNTTVVNGSIYFSSSPSGASVYLNNTLKGTTAFTLYNVTPGDYRVLMEESGYHPYTDTITVTAGNQAAFYGKLVVVPVETTPATTAATPVITTYTPVPTVKRTTVPVPTTWPSETPAPASPVGTLEIIGAVGIAVAVMRK